MNIVISNIADVVPNRIDESKVELANKIIKGIHPLFNELYAFKKEGLKELREDLRAKKLEVKTNKEELEARLSEYKRKKKVGKLLDRLSKLVSSGLVYQGGMRNETVILLRMVDRLPDDKLDIHLNQTMKTISKRFAK